ncbi:MAG TPA: cell division protein FtsL, partial [Actinomycetota bacterium]|nr:cell division protein FtsL [Actinomycetota bacterium]
PQQRNLSIVRRRRRGLIQRGPSRRMTPLVIGGVILVALLIATVLLEQVLMAQSAFKLEEIRRRTERAETRNQELVLEVTHLGNRSRIEEYARTQLGMAETNAATSEYMVADIEVSADTRLAHETREDDLDLDLDLTGTSAIVTGQGESP